MGEIFRFVCPNCEYRADVAGGPSGGFYSTTTTILCLDCKKVYDVEDGKKLMPEKDADIESEPIAVRCPKSAKHKWSIWGQGYPCPRCNSKMSKDMSVALWD